MVHRSFYHSLFLVSLGLFAPDALARLQPVEHASVASDIDQQCQIKLDNSVDCTTTFRYTLLKPAGVKRLAEIAFTYPPTDGFEVLNAESTQPGGVSIPLHDTLIDTRLLDAPERGFLQMRQTSLKFNELRVGSRIGFTVREHYAAKPSTDEFHMVMQFWPEDERRDSFKGVYSAARPILWRGEWMEGFTLTPSADNKTLQVEQKAPVYEFYVDESEDTYHLTSRRLELSSSLDPQQHFGSLARQYNQILSKTLPPESSAAVTHVQGMPAELQVANLLQHISERYRYLGTEVMSEKGHVPFELEEIEQRRYGDHKDLAVLLAAMLHASQIKAETAWVIKSALIEPLLIPGREAPNHVVVRAEVNGQIWWLDPTAPVFVPGEAIPYIQDRWALVSDDKGLIRQEHIPAQPPRNTVTVNRHEHYDAGGKARISAAVELRGDPLMRLSIADRYGDGDEDICKVFASETADCQVTRAQTAFVMPDAYSLTITMNDDHALEKHERGYAYVDRMLSRKWADVFNYKRDGQRLDLYLGSAGTLDYTVTVSGLRRPRSIQGCRLRSPWYDFDLSGERTNGDWRYHYTLTQKKHSLTHDEIVSAPFEKMLDEARRCVGQVHQVVKRQ